jgi:hypothetical protein
VEPFRDSVRRSFRSQGVAPFVASRRFHRSHGPVSSARASCVGCRKVRSAVSLEQKRSGARRVACLVALGCFLGAATAGTAGATTFSWDAPALASWAAPALARDCVTHHTNVIGSTNGSEYGAKGLIYVNTQATLSGLHDALYRSFYGFSDYNNFVEVGWGAGANNITGDTNPTVYAYWVNAGTPGQSITGSHPSYNTDYKFRLENVGDINI